MKTKNKNGIIISAMAGVGKTYLAEKYANVIDLESSYFKYKNQPTNKTDMEKAKGNKNRIPNEKYPKNYIDAILEAQKKYDIVLVRMNANMEIDFYDIYNIKYAFCCPTKSAYASYEKRFKERGNSDEWIAKNKKYFLVAYQRCKNFKGKKIILHKDEYLETALLKRNFKLIQK